MDLKSRLTELSNIFKANPSPDHAEALLQEIENIKWGLVADIESAKKVFFDSGRQGSESLPLKK